MIVVPTATPVITPVVLPAVATAVLPLVQVPPAFGSLNVVGLPVQAVSDPVMAPGVWFTVTVVVAGVPHPLL